MQLETQDQSKVTKKSEFGAWLRFVISFASLHRLPYGFQQNTKENL